MESSVISTSTWRAMWRLALPVLAEESLTMLVGYTDWWLAGHYLRTPHYLAAMALMVYVMWLLMSLFSAVAIGSTAMVARAIGAGDTGEANRVLQQALLAGGLLAAALSIIVLLVGRPFIAIMQLDEQASTLVWQYVRIMIPAIPFIMLEQVGAACLRGAGDTVSGFAAKSIVNIVNVALSPLCLLGVGPFPEMGWNGLAVGTAAGHIVGGTLLLVVLLHGRGALRLKLTQLKLEPPLLIRLARIGTPAGIDIFAVLACHLTYVSIINRLGSEASAAHGLGVQIEALSYLPGTAFHVAAATLSGQCLGAGHPARAQRSVLVACLTGCAVMSCAAIAFVTAGESLAAFFTGDRSDPTVQHAARLLKIVAISTPSLGVLSILTGGLRGAGDTRLPLLITFIGLAGIRIPFACLFAWDEITIPLISWRIDGYGWGVDGAWWAMTADVILRSVLVSIRFFQGGWKNVRV